MDNKENKQPVEEKTETLLKPGAKVMPFLLIAFALVFFISSIQLYKEDPVISGSATFPLIVSGVMLLLSIVDCIQKLMSKSEIAGKPFKEKIVAVIKFVMPFRCFIFLLMAVGYYFLLQLGVGFIIASSIFLMASMCYLMRGQYVKNAIYTAICVAALYVIFKVVFKVFLP